MSVRRENDVVPSTSSGHAASDERLDRLVLADSLFSIKSEKQKDAQDLAHEGRMMAGGGDRRTFKKVFTDISCLETKLCLHMESLDSKQWTDIR